MGWGPDTEGVRAVNCCLIRRGCVKLGVRRGRQWRPLDPTRPPLTLRRQEAIEVSVVPSPAVRLERQGAFLSRICGVRRIKSRRLQCPPLGGSLLRETAVRPAQSVGTRATWSNGPGAAMIPLFPRGADLACGCRCAGMRTEALVETASLSIVRVHGSRASPSKAATGKQSSSSASNSGSRRKAKTA